MSDRPASNTDVSETHDPPEEARALHASSRWSQRQTPLAAWNVIVARGAPLPVPPRSGMQPG